MKFINEIYDKSGFCVFPDISKYLQPEPIHEYSYVSDCRKKIKQESEKHRYQIPDLNCKSRNLFSKIRSIETGKASIHRSISNEKRIMSKRNSNSSVNRSTISRNKRTVNTIASLYRITLSLIE